MALAGPDPEPTPAPAVEGAPEPLPPGRLLVVVPAYNEAASLRRLLPEIARELPGASVLVVDDGSRDRTFEVARDFAPCARAVQNLGIGGAVQTGIRYADREGFELCVQVDGDGQHPPAAVRKLLDVHARTGADIVIGSRFLEGRGFQSSAARRLGIRVIALALRLLFGRAIRDCTSGLRLLDRKAIALFARDYPRDFPEPISGAIALRQGLVIEEVPVEMRERAEGASSIAGVKPLLYMIRVLGYLVLTRLSDRGSS
jgi:glycosyltransferase involved in cell wall biosynthesis